MAEVLGHPLLVLALVRAHHVDLRSEADRARHAARRRSAARRGAETPQAERRLRVRLGWLLVQTGLRLVVADAESFPPLPRGGRS